MALARPETAVFYSYWTTGVISARRGADLAGSRHDRRGMRQLGRGFSNAMRKLRMD
jgi:hypothetical protein